MKIALEMTTDEAHLLRTHLARYIEALDKDLVRTDKHELQHMLAGEITSLRAIAARLGDTIAG